MHGRLEEKGASLQTEENQVLTDHPLFLIDGTGPFFRGNARAQINWSKIDFSDLDAGGSIPEERCRQIGQDFRTFTGKAAAMGFNAVTLDDLAHLIDLPQYPDVLRRKIGQYRALYRDLFRIAAESGLRVFITTDLLFFNPAIDRLAGRSRRRARIFTADCCRRLFEDFPDVTGIVFRIGERDGVDVQGDFRSRLVLKTPSDARRMLETLLPVFEEQNRLLIFRTWTVGISGLGDLIWNRETFRRVFRGIDSPNLIISMKHGESDFFRFLPLNRLFFESEHRKLIEFQARREYEGFGRFPSFIGRDVEETRHQLAAARNMAGISVWCQTGGWSGCRRLTLLEAGGIWNEINTFVTLRVFRDRLSTDRALQAFCKEHLQTADWPALRELLDLSASVIKTLLYIDEFATRRIFFRRLRMPPLITVYWDHILINHLTRKFLRCYVSSSCGRELVRSGYHALRKIRRMCRLAAELGLPQKDLEFQYDTFRIIAAARAYYFLPHPKRTLLLLQKMKKNYDTKWPEPRYNVHIDPRPFPLRRAIFRRVLSILMRRQSSYRRLDRVLGIVFYSTFRPFLRRLVRRFLPDFTRKQAMGVDSLFE